MNPNEDFCSPDEDSPICSVNCGDPDSILQICPERPQLSSQAAGWDGLILKEHHQPAHTTPAHEFTQHVLILSPLDEVFEVEYQLGELSFQGSYGNGEIMIIPAHTRQQCKWHRGVKFLSLSLEPQFFETAAYDLTTVNRFELLPNIAVQDRLIYDIGTALRQELNTLDLADHLYVDSLVTALSIHLMKRYCAQVPRISDPSDKGLSPVLLNRALTYINDQLDQNLKLVDLAKEVGMSRYYFSRLFKKSMGIAPHQYAIKQRIEKAKRLLKQSNIPIAMIAQQCGFTNPSHLSKYFRQLTGVTPKAFRDQYR